MSRIALRRLPATVVPILAFLAVLAATTTSARAEEPRWLGDYGKWIAFAYSENGGKVCYMAAKPDKEEGKYKRRGAVHALITHRPKRKAFGVVSFVLGYTLKKDSKVSVRISKKTFALFTHKDTAWAPDKNTDKALVQAMVRGNRMVVTGVSARGTKTKDTYSLRGFTRAHRRINAVCGVK